MDRKEFLKACTGGLCACAVASLPTAAKAADAPKPEDWRLGFVKRRYAKLLSTLSSKMDQASLSASLQEVGTFCASENSEKINKFKGDIDGYCSELAKGGTEVTRDDARGVYTVTGAPVTDCWCPLASLAAKTPGVMCECTLGWTKHNWDFVLQRETKVVLKESVLRGGKRCAMEITAV